MKNKKVFKFLNYKNRSNVFLFFLTFVITLFTLVAVNDAAFSAKELNSYYIDYPQNYSLFQGLPVNKYKDFMKKNFYNLEYKTFYEHANTENFFTNINSSDKLEIELIGCVPDFEKYPIPSAFKRTIMESFLIEGESFTKADMIQENNAIIMYYSQLRKINFTSSSKISINNRKYVLKGVLADTSDIKSNINENKIQIFMPYTTMSNIIEGEMSVNNVIKTEGRNFPWLAESNAFVTYSKIKPLFEQAYWYNLLSKAETIFGIFCVSFIATIILQVFIIKNRYNEIGIRRAVGASKDSIIFMFTSKSILVLIVGMLTGIASFLIIHTAKAIVATNFYHSSMFIIDWKASIISLSAYFAICYLSVFIPSFIGSNVNISNVLVEER